MTAEAVSASVAKVKPQLISIKGKYYGDVLTASRTVYDMSTGNVVITLNDAESYDKYYIVKIDGVTYQVATEEVLPAEKNSVSLRNVVISKNKKTATVNVYNTTYEKVTAEIEGVNSNGEKITAEIAIDAESVGTVNITGEQMGNYTWSVSKK